MRQLSFILLGCLSALNVMALPIRCPDLADISLTNGEYAWQSKDSLWEGYFVAPRTGVGESSKIDAFLEARWIQLNTLSNPQGVVECDYAGNMPNEVIRFVMLNAQGGPTPTANGWSCIFNPVYPSPQCSCSGDPVLCEFEKS